MQQEKGKIVMGNDIRLATLVALLGSWGAAHAMQPLKKQDGETGPLAKNVQMQQTMPEFSSLDRDADGSISEQEAGIHQGVAALFAEMDKNRDRQLSAREYVEVKIRLGR